VREIMAYGKLAAIALLVMCFLLFSETAGARISNIPVDPQVFANVVKIDSFSESRKGRVSGTGFLVSRGFKSNWRTGRALFLVTNKHMLSDWTLADGNISKFNKNVTIHFHKDDPSAEAPPTPVTVDLCDNKGRVILQRVEAHMSGHVDLAVIYLGRDREDGSNSTLASFDVRHLIPFDKITTLDFKVGSRVFVLGYPYGITSMQDNDPIAKYGFIASHPGTALSLKMKVKNRKKKTRPVMFHGKVMIVKGPVGPGHSGGPVISPSKMKPFRNPRTRQWEYFTNPSDNLVIGILSGGFGSSGYCYIYSSDYIIETIDQLFKRRRWVPTERWP
jgi:hypothetical protein